MLRLDRESKSTWQAARLTFTSHNYSTLSHWLKRMSMWLRGWLLPWLDFVSFHELKLETNIIMICIMKNMSKNLVVFLFQSIVLEMPLHHYNFLQIWILKSHKHTPVYVIYVLFLPCTPICQCYFRTIQRQYKQLHLSLSKNKVTSLHCQQYIVVFVESKGIKEYTYFF